jgi:hypothetical protein
MDAIIKNFMDNMNSLNEKDYMFNLITYGIAPTICGYKSSSLITLSDKYKNTYKLWKIYKEEFLNMIPLKCFELNENKEVVTALFYDEDDLSMKIRQKENMNFLEIYGYDHRKNIVDYLYKLKERYKTGCPHEIGLFLDIPLKDILGFIENNGNNFLYCGYWKVYCNMEEALEIFEKYTWSKRKVIELIGHGKNTFEIIRRLKKYNIKRATLV